MTARRQPAPLLDLRFAQRLATATHQFWYRMTGGLVGGNFFGTKILLLTTTGRRTGRKHTTPLTYVEDGDDFVVIASNGGNERHPQWWLNLRADPSAEIQAMSRNIRVSADEAEGDDRERIWHAVTRRYPVYAGYERRTSRRIPVVLLHPD
ncbi:MAG: nitroreductase family deazaflavin-dependent oxidoreductase [Dehalococcoidia bacterium]